VRDPSIDWPAIGNSCQYHDGDDKNDDAHCSFLCGGIGSRRKFPAVYYEIEVLRGGNERATSCLRRYSQFDALCRKLDPDGVLGLRKSLPPKTYTLDSWRSNDVIDERMGGLRDFLCHVLSRRECAHNPLIATFLELEEELDGEA
jgi:hypothetical protein